ncbi:TRAP transporter substrate-binding protein [Gramella sp. AN32]|uniref:TRAP transporter substrate-binding protein n=1 Tax=Christiangramia antarctica TaxID=2058158 RepID=A0ABW5X2J2_9FLAO|nr:TRAP transporter substrate-binding protein [Gramella sp. AN32]MCM4157925.1 TRAP transporter substrate-binding protein DctP [Gramella sp. AN32]
MNYIKILCVLLVGSFILLFASCEAEKKTTIIKLGHGLDITHPVHKGMMFMAKRLKEKSAGSMQIDIYPNQQLGSERECLELLQIGSLGMTKVSTAIMGNFASELKVFGLPFLFRDRDHRFAVIGGKIGEKLLNASLDKRLKGLTFYDAGSRSFYSKTPIKGPEDLEGLKLRVMESQTAIQMVKLLGGSPTPISSGELYTALQQGIVDGAENNPPTFYLTRDYEVCKYYILDEHTAIPDELVIGTPLWNKLTKQEQEWLKEAAVESTEYQKEIWRKAELHALEEVKKAGVTVFEAKKDEFKELVKPMYVEFALDPKMEILIEEIQNTEQ